MDAVTLAAANAAARKRFAPISGGLSTQPTPLIIAHRFGANVVPEESMEGARVISALGASCLELDTQVLGDNSVCVMHDATVDRTTTATGNVADLSAPRVAQLVMDAGTWFGGGWGNCTVPTLDGILREFGNKMLIVPEAKSVGTGAALVGMLKRFGISTDHALIQTFLDTEVPVAVAAGYPVMRLISGDGTTYTPTQAQAAGVKWVGLPSTAATTLVAPFHAVGVKVAVYTVSRQSDLAAWSAVGVDGIFSDDPLYTTDLQGVRTADPFAAKSYWHGQIASDGQTDRGVWSGTNEWGSNIDETATRSILHGWATPKLKERNAAGGTFQIDLSYVLDTQNATQGTNSFIEFFLSTTDIQYTSASRAGQNGYMFYFNGLGRLRVYRVDGGVSTQIANTSSAAPVLGSWDPLRINVTPTQLTVTRTAIGTANVATIADSTYRPLNYLYSVRGGMTYRMRGVTIS